MPKVELEVTLDSEGRDRVFRVTIKWVAQVSRVLVPRRRSPLELQTINWRCFHNHGPFYSRFHI